MYSILSRNEPLPLPHHNFLPRGAGRVSLVWRGGHVIGPLFGDWFGPRWPKLVVKFYCPWRILPLLRWRVGETVGYFGFKAFGVDNEHYKNWLPPEHVQDGSYALTPSWRFDAEDHE